MNWFQSFWKSLTGASAGEPPVRVTIQNKSAPDAPPSESISNFTPRAQQVLALARKEADRLNHNVIGTEHLLLGLIKLGQGTAVNVLGKMGIDLEIARTAVERKTGTGPDAKLIANVPYSPRVKKVLALATREAKALNHTYVGTEHLLLGLLREGDGIAARVLKDLNVDLEKTRQEILKELDPNFPPVAAGQSLRPQPQTPGSKLPTSSSPPGETVDLSKRYDVHCSDYSQGVMVHRNVRFKGVKHLFAKSQYDALSGYVELEQSDGQTVFVSRSSIIKFCEHGATPGPENAASKQ